MWRFCYNSFSYRFGSVTSSRNAIWYCHNMFLLFFFQCCFLFRAFFFMFMITSHAKLNFVLLIVAFYNCIRLRSSQCSFGARKKEHACTWKQSFIRVHAMHTNLFVQIQFNAKKTVEHPTVSNVTIFHLNVMETSALQSFLLEMIFI